MEMLNLVTEISHRARAHTGHVAPGRSRPCGSPDADSPTVATTYAGPGACAARCVATRAAPRFTRIQRKAPVGRQQPETPGAEDRPARR